MKLSFIGAIHSVTGSMTLITKDNYSFLVDAGLYQGVDENHNIKVDSLVDAKTITAVFLTHAHLDHCGYLPRLVKRGFRGKIFATLATKKVAQVILEDYARIELDRCKRANKKIKKEKLKKKPFYDLQDVARALQLFVIKSEQETFKFKNLTLKMIRSGHILGSVSCLIDEKHMFSGDIGRSKDLLHLPRQSVENKMETLVLEATYGNRIHSKEDAKEELAQVIKESLQGNGKLIIAAFSFGRSQIITYLLYLLKQDLDLMVVIDSPMTKKIFDIYLEHQDELAIHAGEFKKALNSMRVIEFPNEREQLIKKNLPMIIVTSSGMLSGGVIQFYLEHCAASEENTFLLTGYQADETIGFEIQQGSRLIMVNNREIQFNAKVRQMHTLSAHADQKELIQIVKEINPKRVILNHGEEQSKESLKRELNKFTDCIIADENDLEL